MRYDEEEPQHFLGIPIGRASYDPVQDGRTDAAKAAPWWRRGREDTRQRVLGIPTTGFRMRPIDLPWLRHPIRFTRWRLEVRRLGPYARKFDDIS